MKSILLGLLLFTNIQAISQNVIKEDTSEVTKAHNLLETVKKKGKFIAQLDSSYIIDLPVGIGVKDNKKAESYAIIISELKVKKGKTFLTAYMAFTVPGTTKKVAFRGTDIPFSFEGGFNGPVRLDLVSDFDVKLSKASSLVLKGNGRTYVTCDCNGFEEMHLTADLLFDSTLFVPENPDGSLKNNASLKTTFETNIADWDDLMIAVSLEPFQIKGLTGVGFSVTNATFDLSDTKNPPGISFSPKHQSNYFVDGSQAIWQGLYIQDARVRLPMQFRKKTASEPANDSLIAMSDPTGKFIYSDSIANDRLNFFAQNLLIDELGFTGSLGVSRLMSLDEGDLGGWAFSVEDFMIDIQASQLMAAGFSGQIIIPQFGKNSLFNYSAIMGLNDTYAFSVGITEELKMDLWAASLKINPNSTLNIELEDKKFIPSLLFNGEINLNAPVNKNDTASKKLTIARIPFEGMKIQTVEPYFSVEKISFGTSQNKFSKFPVSINEIEFEHQPNRFGLSLGLNVGFSPEKDGGFAGNGKFTVWGKRENNSWSYDGLEIGKIAVNINKPGGFALKGEVDFFKSDSLQNDAVFGDGFKGMLKASFGTFGSVDTMGIQATALFGNVEGNRYWFADALATMPGGIPAGPVSIYGFGGGAWYHMKQIGIEEKPSGILGRSISGIYYKPDFSSGLGLKAMVKFGTTANKNAFNGDLAFGISFTNSGGLNQTSLTGNGYFATGNFQVLPSDLMKKAGYIINKSQGDIEIPKETENSQLYGNVKMLFDYPSRTFHSTFDVYVNIAGGLITGMGSSGKAGWGVMHFSPDDWYIHLGTPDNPNGINVLGLAKMTNYFMAGKTVPELPSPPQHVLQSLVKEGQTIPLVRNNLALEQGSGFAMGAGFNFDTGERDLLIFYGRFGCGIGMDILMKNYGNLSCEGQQGPIGISGWYAQGQAWAWIAAAIGIKVDLPFYSGRYKIFEMDVAALLQAKAPNPFWLKGNVGGNYNILNGLVKGRCDFDFEIGEQCKIPTSSPFGGMPIIAEIKPSDKETDVSVFATPQVIFNMPVGDIIEFENDKKELKQFRISLQNFKVTSGNGQLIEGTLNWNERKDVLVFKQKDILPGETSLNIMAEVVFEENKNGSWFKVMKNGHITRESKNTSFTTGKEPSTIDQSNISFSYPGYRAFNYYQDESANNFIKLDIGQPKLFQLGTDWVQKVRIIPISGGQAKYSNYSYDNGNNLISFSLPEGLENNKIYQLELVDIPAGQAVAMDENVTRETSVTNFESEGYKTEVEITTQNAQESREELKEKVLYSMEFRTSNYNTFGQKLDALAYSDGIGWELYPLVHSLTVNINGERFDNYEVVNLKEQTLVSCELLLSETGWYQKYIAPVIELSPSNLSLIGAEKFKLPALGSYIFESNGTRRLTDDEVKSGIADDIQVLSGMKNYIAKYTSEYMYLLKNKIANKYVNGGIPQGQLSNLLNAGFTPLKYGNYPVNIKYTLPGKDNPNSAKKYVISFVD